MSSKSNRRTRRVKMDMENQYNDGYEKREKEFNKKVLIPRNKRQEQYLHLLRTKDIVFAHGMVGCSKTLLALYIAFELLDARKIEKIYITRPRVVVAGEEKLGALPGTLAEKSEPYLMAIVDCLSVFMTKTRIDYLMKARDKPDAQIEYLSFDYLRGRSLNNCVVICEESQNITSHSMFTLLSRIGENSKIFINGDSVQRDLKSSFGISGLEDALYRLRDLPQVGDVKFIASDIERSPLAKSIILKYLDLYE